MKNGLALIVLLVSTLLCVEIATPSDSSSDFTAEERGYWAFQPIQRPVVPETTFGVDSNASRQLNASVIDRFLIHRMAQRGVTFSKLASRTELIRRVYFDLLGLPPSPREIEHFVADNSVDSYERLIERLLANPHYGETWGRHWLDLVRYSETAGFNADPDRPLAYKYRDYVIRAFNSDTPYDRFVQEQIAGDELFPSNSDALIATGFNRMWPDESNASNVLLARQDALNDLTANVGAVFLGLSFGCAQCHDHKFDPILQTDFYQLQAFFSGIVLEDKVSLGTQDELREYQTQRDDWLKRTEDVRHELHNMELPARRKVSAIKRLKFPSVVLDAIDTLPEERSTFQRQIAFWSERQIEVKEEQLVSKLTKRQRERRNELKQELSKLQKERPVTPKLLQAMSTIEVNTGPAKTHLLSGGSYDQPESEVRPGFPAVLAKGAKFAMIEKTRSGSSGRRSTLSKWLTSSDNPLVARVMVNRIWQGHFGRGLVSNNNDFGRQAQPPSHPHLLDWLAAEFIESGWSIKSMHRLIMLSNVYRQSTDRQPLSANKADIVRLQQSRSIDPGNQLYWHYPRRRLTAEAIRDSMLLLSGKLNTEMNGPGVKPILPPKFSSREKWAVSKSEAERNRRSVYIHAKRNLPYPLMQVFDFPDMHESCAQRTQTTVAPQALMLLNSKLILDLARSFADQLSNEADVHDLHSLVVRSYLFAFGRKPTSDELQAAITFVAKQQALLKNSNQRDGNDSQWKDAAIADFCHALFNANEFVYVD